MRELLVSRVLLDELSTDNALNHARPLTREDMLRVVNSSVEQAVQGIRADLADLRVAFAAPLAPVADIPAAAPLLLLLLPLINPRRAPSSSRDSGISRFGTHE